ncbi:PDR/VanB family oxidoreductase [Streptomyces platensis]|uniref:PDR/VanB family oxidoreductase n=1 Tax=Streptomyces platensis TaxID=58346 RepID=UPI0037B64E8A
MDPQLWWYLARVGGLMSWWLLSATVLWGLLLSTRLLGPRPTRIRLLDLHRLLSLLSLAFLAVHLLSLVADSWVDLGLWQLIVPFISDYRPVAVAWGVIALYLAAAIQVTSLLKSRIPYRWWRGIHTTTFALFVLTTVHALTAGTDARAVRWTGLLLAAAVAFLSTYRLLAGRRMDDRADEARTASAPARQPIRRELPGSRSVVVHRIREIVDDVALVELVAADGDRLPAWEPGAHIDLGLPSGRIRPYSLCGDPADPTTYRIAVRRAPAPEGRGGSAEVHRLRAGQKITLGRPRNRFPLVLADQYLFIAGGIGITPLLPMIRAAAAADREWRLLYGGRTHTAMAFADELLALDGDRVRLVPQDAEGLPDLGAALAGTRPGTSVYCCGPDALITAVQQTVAADFPDRHLHTERFGGTAPEPAPTGHFTVELRRSGRILPVAADRTLLDVIREAVPDAPASCEEGVCGSCELRVLSGTPDHRDTVLPDGERTRHDVIYPCVSRAHGEHLVVDL